MTIPLINYPSFRPYSNIVPFTVRDGATYLLQIETLLAWVRNDLVPHIDKEIAELTTNWDETTLELIGTWEQMSASLILRVEQAEAAIGSAVTEAEAAKAAAEAARDLAELYASQTEAVQDTAVTSIFTTADSQFRLAFNAVIDDILREDPDDPGTFIISSVAPPPEPSEGVTPDPTDPGFFV